MPTPLPLRVVCLAAAALLLICGCTRQAAKPPSDGLISAAQLALVTQCMAARGLAVPTRSGAPNPRADDALFGTGARELSVTLPTGYTVTANSDGCLASAQQQLYGDLRSWFRTQTITNNLRAEAAARMSRDPAYRAAMDRWNRCGTGTRDLERCHQQSGLVALRTRMEAGQLRHVRTLHRGDLALYRTLRARAADRAERVLARARPLRPPRPQPT